jgi:hypothetical protein
MSDILSGGVIDDSTSGPIPSNLDDRKRDIIAEQKEAQRQDAIGGTEVPPTPSQPQQIPEPPQVAPPLPVIPSFEFNIPASLAEETREVARQATIDVIKNVTINGQGPSIEGSTISFNIPQERPANEVFVFQGIAIPQSQLSQVTQPQIQQQPTIQLDRNQEIQSVTVSSPQAVRVTTEQTQEPQVTIQESRSAEIKAIPAATTQEEAVQPEIQKISTAPLVEAESIPLQEPTVPQSQSAEPRSESIGERQVRENNERAARNREIRSALGLGEASPFDEPPEVVPRETVPIGQKQDIENNERAERNREIRSNLGLGNESPLDKYEGVSFGERQDAELSERRERDKKIRRDLGLGEISPFDEETDVAKGFKAAEERYRQRIESGPNFDRESDVRQKGERYSDFKERQEALKEERSERAEAVRERAELQKRLKDGGIAETPSGMVPVALTRADGQKRILAYLSSEFVGVVEGGESQDRITSLPAEGDYYEAGGGGAPDHPWKIRIRTIPETEPPEYEYMVVSGKLYTGIGGWDSVDVEGLNEWKSAQEGNVILFGEVTNGECSAASIKFEETLPDRIKYNDLDQEEFNTVIGYLFTYEGTFSVKQDAFQNFTLTQFCVDSKSAIYPIST